MGTAPVLAKLTEFCSHAESCLPLDLNLTRQHGDPEAYLCYDVLSLFLPHRQGMQLSWIGPNLEAYQVKHIFAPQWSSLTLRHCSR